MAVIADVFDVILIDSDGEVAATTTLQDANIEVSVQENDVRGGKGNQLLGILHADRDISITMNDINFRYEFLAKNLGQDIVTGAGTAYAMPKWYVAVDGATAGSADVEITLDETPLSVGHELAIYNEDGVKITGFTVTGDKVDFSAATPTVAIGDDVEVRTFKYATPATSQEIKIDNSVFSKGLKAVLETIEVDEATETVTHKIQYEFTQALPTGAFTVNTASERTAQTQAFNLRVVKPKSSTEVGYIKRIPING
jgi:hypothetical protein